VRSTRARPQNSRIVVDITDRQKLIRVGKPFLERLVRRTLAAEDIERAEISVLLIDDRRIAALHAEWLGDASPTDVITFDLSEPGEDLLRGDIVVSTETARRASREFDSTPRQEVAYYVVHGLLHLAGYDDRTPRARRAMRLRERAVMRIVGQPHPSRRRATRGRA